MVAARLNPSDESSRRRIHLCVHGAAVSLRCVLPGIRQILHDWMSEYVVDHLPEGFHAIEGDIEPYDADIVTRRISPTAHRIGESQEMAEIWRDGERYWLLDENWGLTEINLLRRTFRSWVLPTAQADPTRCMEHAVLWPLSQVLGSRGLWLVPAPSVALKQSGLLMLCAYNLEPELSILADAGVAMVGQRWTIVQDDGGRAALLDFGGRVQRSPAPQLRRRLSEDDLDQTTWTDLTAGGMNSCPHAFATAILLIEPGRRATASCRPITGASAMSSLKHAWPIPDMPNGHRIASTLALLAQQCRLYRVELSRRPADILHVLRVIDIVPKPQVRTAIAPTSTADGVTARR